MRNHALEINVLPTGEALCWICSPAYGEVRNLTRNPVQRLTLKDDYHRVEVSVTGRQISLDDIKRIARQAVERDFDVKS